MTALETLAFTSDLIGKVLIGVAVLRVHTKLKHEGKIDKKVFKSIRKERWWTYLGIIFLIIGYILHLV